MIAEVLENKWVRATALLGAIIGISIVLYLLSAVLVPLFFAFIVAYIFDPVIDKIETYKISRVGAIVTLVGGITLAAIIFPFVVVPSIILQVNSMMETPQGVTPSEERESKEKELFRERVAHKIEDVLALDLAVRLLGWDQPRDGGHGEEAVVVPSADQADENAKTVEVEASAMTEGDPDTNSEGSVSATVTTSGDLDSLAIINARVSDMIRGNAENLMQSLFPKWKDAGSSVLRMIGFVSDTFLSMFLFVGNFVLFAFVAIYLLKDYDHIVAYGDSLVPHRNRLRVRDIMGRIDRQLRSFLRGQFMVCCCLGVMYAIGLTIAGAPFSLLLALFGALASFVPYLGLVLTIGPAVGLTILFYGGFDWHLVGVLVTFVVAQFLEGNFLTPKIVGSQVGLGPVWVILAIMIFSSTLGFIGLLLAVPIAAVLKVLAEEALLYYRTSAFFSDDPSEAS